MPPYTLRPYQADAVQATLEHFRKTDDPAVIVLPTGAGKSLVIAELARLARQRILVLAHVKELVEQNCAKYDSYADSDSDNPIPTASVFSAGLNRKEFDRQVIFGSVQSVVRNLDFFNDHFSLLIIDECHRVSPKLDSQYQQIIRHLQSHNKNLKVLGLTATPYRLNTDQKLGTGNGWIYRQHRQANEMRGDENSVFSECIFELPLRYMIDKGYLTPATLLDAPVALYDFEQLRPNSAGSNNHPSYNGNSAPHYSETELNRVLSSAKRATARITAQVVELAEKRQGVMIFAATVMHAKEIITYLPPECSAIIIGDMKAHARDGVINAFKNKQIKFLVNVSVLTTGFDAPHVDLIAILRPTESVGLYQQIIGRGLRLCDDKKDCLVLDYAGNNYDLFRPEISSRKPNSESVPVQVPCPICQHINNFWGLVDNDGDLIEHYGRRCQGLTQDDEQGEKQQCDFRYRFKECGHCGAENDIAARQCLQCQELLVDPDEKLKQALLLNDCKVLRCSGFTFESAKNKAGQARLKITYFDEDGADLSEFFALDTPTQKAAFQRFFCQQHLKDRQNTFKPENLEQTLAAIELFRAPDFVIAKQEKIKGSKNAPIFWRISEKIFDYQGRYRRANELI